MNMHTGYVGALTALCLLSLAAPAMAGPQYRFHWGSYGDTASPVDINDHGVIAWAGFCDSGFCGSRFTAVGNRGGADLNLPFHLAEFMVSDINNAGELLGVRRSADGWSPALWRDGVEYDLTDPANAGLVFQVDPGPKWATFDLLTLDVLDLPPTFRPKFCAECPPEFFDFGWGWNYYPPSQTASTRALTNLHHDLVFSVDGMPGGMYGVLEALKVSEPPTAALVLLAAGLAWAGRSGGQRMQRG